MSSGTEVLRDPAVVAEEGELLAQFLDDYASRRQNEDVKRKLGRAAAFIREAYIPPVTDQEAAPGAVTITVTLLGEDRELQILGACVQLLNSVNLLPGGGTIQPTNPERRRIISYLAERYGVTL